MSSLLRRVAPAVVLTGSAVAIVSMFDPGVATLTGGDVGTASAAVPAPSASAEAGTEAGTDSGTTTPDAETTTPDAGATTSPQAAASCDTAEEVTGPVVQTEWGPVQVAAKVVDGRVCQARAVVYPDGDRKSVFINQQALPIINARAAEQGVEFDAVSGATVTSEGYRQSLQALLDSLG